MNMVSFWEILDRATNTGPVMETKDFDMLIFKTASELVKEYDLHRDPDVIIPSDNSLADDVFEAGLRLYTETGTYCISSKRQIKFTEDEIKEALKQLPKRYLIGEGAEAMWMEKRDPEDTKVPLNLGGVIEGNPQEGEMYVKLYQSIAQEKHAVDGVYFGPCFTIEGKPWRPGTPLEVHAGILAATWVREALRRVGRPGLHLTSACPSAIGDIAGCNPEWGVRPTDSITMPTTTELKTEYDSLSKVAFSLSYGCIRNPYWLPLIGGFAGGPEGAAIVGVAGGFHSLLVNQTRLGGYNSAGAILVEPTQTGRVGNWTSSLMWQALTRNSNTIGGRGAVTAAGPGTEMMLYEIASLSIGVVVSGGHIFHGTKRRHLVKPNLASGMEPRFQGEVAKATAGLKRTDVNDILKGLIPKFESKLGKGAPEGKSFDELYDLKTLEPKKEYLDIYNKVRGELEDLGLHFRN